MLEILGQMCIIGSRPPFLVLDEIDAHLDHSNVQVYRGKRRPTGRGLGSRNLGGNVRIEPGEIKMSHEILGFHFLPSKWGLFVGSWGWLLKSCRHGGSYVPSWRMLS